MEAFLAVLGEAAAQQSAERRRGAAGQRGPLRLLHQDEGERLGHVGAIKRPLAGQHLVEDHAERPDVGLLVHHPSLGLFRRHVGRRAQDHAHAGGRCGERGGL